eukprot:358584-Chlamydomonas_euryale.AAC.2
MNPGTTQPAKHRRPHPPHTLLTPALHLPHTRTLLTPTPSSHPHPPHTHPHTPSSPHPCVSSPGVNGSCCKACLHTCVAAAALDRCRRGAPSTLLPACRGRQATSRMGADCTDTRTRRATLVGRELGGSRESEACGLWKCSRCTCSRSKLHPQHLQSFALDARFGGVPPLWLDIPCVAPLWLDIPYVAPLWLDIPYVAPLWLDIPYVAPLWLDIPYVAPLWLDIPYVATQPKRCWATTCSFATHTHTCVRRPYTCDPHPHM